MKIDVKDVMENKQHKVEKEKTFTKKPLCDSTEAQARRIALKNFRRDFSIKMMELRLQIEENNKTIPLTTNEAYSELDLLEIELNKLFTKLIDKEKENVLLGD